MKAISTNPVNLILNRKGGCVITSRLNFWVASQAGWQLAGSSIFQNVTSPREHQTITLPSGSYTVVSKYFVEESVNGVYEFEMFVSNQSIGSKGGDINTTSNPHDSMTFKNQFVLEVQGGQS